MSKKIKWLAVVLLCSLFLAGCSMDTKTQVVVPKNQKENSLIAKESEGNLAEQIQAPVRYQCDKEINGIRLVANARVIVPDVEGIKLKKIVSRHFTAEDMKNIQEYLFEGQQLYTIDLDALNAYIEKENESIEAGKNIVETEYAVPEEEFDGEARDENFSSAVQSTVSEPQTVEEAQQLLVDFLKGKKTFMYNYREDLTILQDVFRAAAYKQKDLRQKKYMLMLYGLCEEFYYSINEWEKPWYWRDMVGLESLEDICGVAFTSNNPYVFYMNNGTSEMERVSILAAVPWIDMSNEDTINVSPQEIEARDEEVTKEEENLAELDLQKMSNELVKNLGFDSVELTEVSNRKIIYGSIDNEEVLVIPALRFSYTPVVDGVPITMMQTKANYMVDDDIVEWPNETLSVLYGKEGMLSFSWEYPAEVEDWHDEYAFLLPFSEIQNIFEELLISNNETLMNAQISGELTISEVRLGYVRVAGKDLLQEDSNVSIVDGKVVYTGVLVPAWDFIGTAEGVVADMYGVNSGTQMSYMTINAMDGSIIR